MPYNSFYLAAQLATNLLKKAEGIKPKKKL